MAIVPSFSNIRRQREELFRAAAAAENGSYEAERRYAEITGRACLWCSAPLVLIGTSIGPRFICADNSCNYQAVAESVRSSDLPKYAPRFYPRQVG